MWRWGKGRQSFFFMVFLSSGSFGNTRYFWFTAILLILCNFKCRTNHMHSPFLLLCMMRSFSFFYSTINKLLILAPPSLKNSTRLLQQKKEIRNPSHFFQEWTKLNISITMWLKVMRKKGKGLTCKVLAVKHILLLITALTIGDVWSICVLIIEKKGWKSPNILFIPISLFGQTYIKKSDTSKK